MIEFFAKHPTIANLLMILMIVLGLGAIPRLEKETFPDFAEMEVVITVAYPGATAGEVEATICERIEDAVDGVTFVDEVISQARENVGVVTVAMVRGANFQKFISDIKTEIEGIDDFPAQAEVPIIRSRGERQPVVSVAIYGAMSPAELKDYSDHLKTKLQALPGISLVTLKGFSQRQLRIEVSTQKLNALGLSSVDVAQAISAQSIDLPAGSLKTDAQTLLVRLSEERRTAKDFESLVVTASSEGAEVRLADIATIHDTFDLEEEKIVFNGKRAGMLLVEKTSNEDALTIYDVVADFVEKEQAAVPQLELRLTKDLTSITRDRLQMLVKNAWQGLLLVFFTLWLFFNARLSFWVTIGLPISFLAAFFVMPFLGMSINMLTMVALLLALGLLMDDAIVIAENVATHLRRGEKAQKAVIDGVLEVRWGVFSSFLTTVAVFGPITLLEGNIGQVLKVMPVVLILVLSFSLIEAFLILPNHLAHSMANLPKKESNFRRWFQRRLVLLREEVLGRAVDWAVEHRWFTVGCAAGVFIISVGLLAGGVLKFQAFPNLEGDVIEARLQMPDGTPLAQTEKIMTHLNQALQDVAASWQERQPQGKTLIKSVTIQYNASLMSGAKGTHTAVMSVDLLPAGQRYGGVEELLTSWRAEAGPIADAVSLIFTEPSLGPSGYPVEIRLFGQDLDQLKLASGELMRWLSRFEGVFDLQDDLHPGKPEIQIQPTPGALTLGLTSLELARQLRAGYQGSIAQEVQHGGDHFEVEIGLPLVNRNDLEDLENIQIVMPGGALAPLQSIATLSQSKRAYGTIMRVDGRRTSTVRAEVNRNQISVNELMGVFESEFVPQLTEEFPQLSYAIEGETAESRITGKSMAKGFQFGLLAIFLLLSFQFRSYKEPLIVMAAVPMSFVGVVWGHLLLGYPLTMPSMMGFVSLMGVVVNDSILLVIFIKNRIREGVDALEAVRRASRDRFRAVLLTSLTTIAGLLPLLAEQSMQAQILIPLAISLIFGLLASTVLVLILIPCLYAMTGVAHGLVDSHREQMGALSGNGEIA